MSQQTPVCLTPFDKNRLYTIFCLAYHSFFSWKLLLRNIHCFSDDIRSQPNAVTGSIGPELTLIGHIPRNDPAEMLPRQVMTYQENLFFPPNFAS